MENLVDPHQKEWLVQSVSLTSDDLERLDALQIAFKFSNRSAVIRACIFAAYENTKDNGNGNPF